jgi:sterol desaturase/sphingolipid hydroxylase (fatty acid hydroxylase superfamily)
LALIGYLKGLALITVSFGNPWSIPWLFVAFCIGAAFTLHGRNREVPARLLLRAVLPRRIIKSRSGRADWLYTAFNLTAPAFFLGWVELPAAPLRSGLAAFLAAQFGPAPLVQASGLSMAIAATLTFYLSYEVGYWVDHYLKHRFEMLWRFHAVHHTAESLSPLTNFRVHPVDTFIFGNILILSNGIAGGLLVYALGAHATPLTISGANAITLAALGLFGTLQHSHFWITFPKPLDRIFLSPAHHQLHHSRDAAHHNSNYGSTLALFDRLFGTLIVPPADRPKSLAFGVDGIADPQGLRALAFMPFVESLAIVRRPIMRFKARLQRQPLRLRRGGA